MGHGGGPLRRPEGRRNPKAARSVGRKAGGTLYGGFQFASAVGGLKGGYELGETRAAGS